MNKRTRLAEASESLLEREESFDASLIDAEHRVVFTWIIFTICMLLFVWELLVADWVLASWKDNPMIGPDIKVLIECGGQLSTCILQKGQWSRLFSSQFLHGGMLHLGFNMMGLLNIGAQLEKIHGNVTVAFIYLVSGFCAQLTTGMFLPSAVSVGASGSILGLFGAEWADLFVNWRSWQDQQGTQCCRLLVPTLLLVGLSLLPFVNLFAHLSGLVCGLLIGLALAVRRRYRISGLAGIRLVRRTAVQRFCFVAGLLLATFLIFGQLLIFCYGIDVKEYCSWCDKMQCFDTPWWTCQQGVNTSS